MTVTAANENATTIHAVPTGFILDELSIPWLVKQFAYQYISLGNLMCYTRSTWDKEDEIKRELAASITGYLRRIVGDTKFYTVDRRSVAKLSVELAALLYWQTIPPYATDKMGKKLLAQSLEFALHVLLNHMNVDHLYCKNCGDTEQQHAWLDGCCPNLVKSKGSRRFEEDKH